MRKGSILALAFISLNFCVHAAEATYFKFSNLLESESVKDVLDPAVRLYWAAQPAPEFQEVARPDTYTRSSISLSPFGGSKKHCVEAFEKSLKAMIDDARTRGYDAVINIRAARDGKPTEDPAGFSCKPGYKTTEVPLIGTFAMTSAAVQRVAEAEERSLNGPARPASAGAVFLPLDPILGSAEAQAILGPGINAYPGVKAPAYSQRYGPDQYSEDAAIETLSAEEACKRAVLKALRSMVEDAKARDYDSIVKIRSFLDDRFAPVATEVECHLGKKTASVTLQASLASRK